MLSEVVPCRPESVVDFGEKVKAMRNPDTSFAAVFGGNVAQQKLYDCLLTCWAAQSRSRLSGSAVCSDFGQFC